MKTKYKKISIFLIFLIFLTPFLNSNSETIDYIPEISQEENPFYEINPCKISIFQFLNANKRSIFQDHYFFRTDNNSSIKCFGTVTGISVQQVNLETQFYISIGTNSLLNLLLQGLFWLFLFSFIPKNNEIVKLKKQNFLFHIFSISVVSYMLTFSIYAERRYYGENFYLLDLINLNSYFLLFSLFFLLTKLLIEAYLNRSNNVINFLPFIFLIYGLFSGLNMHLFSFIFLYFGLVSLFKGKFNKKVMVVYLMVSLWWLFNSNGSYFLSPGKLRGFSSSVYEFNSNLYWIIFFGLLVLGLYSQLEKYKNSFNLEKFTDNFSASSFLVLVLGIIGANFPILNYFAYYYLGLQRNVVSITNPFIFDQYNVKISWRGIFPSSESIGEFYGLCLIFIMLKIFFLNKMNRLNIIGVFSAGFGLYFSDNRTSIVLVFVIIVFFFLKKFSELPKQLIYLNKKIFVFFTLAILLLFFLFPTLNPETYQFYSQSVLSKSNFFQFDSIYSSFLILLNNSYTEMNTISILFGLFSTVALFLNRSEMWGLFFARYNPTFLEVMIGSGPLNLGQFYGEIIVNDPVSFLLPHSSFLSYVVYFGLFIVFYCCSKFLKSIYENKENYIYVSFSIYFLVNIFKNDSLNYFPLFIFYLVLLFIFNKKKIFQ